MPKTTYSDELAQVLKAADARMAEIVRITGKPEVTPYDRALCVLCALDDAGLKIVSKPARKAS